jgi:hypothetical protein
LVAFELKVKSANLSIHSLPNNIRQKPGFFIQQIPASHKKRAGDQK